MCDFARIIAHTTSVCKQHVLSAQLSAYMHGPFSPTHQIRRWVRETPSQIKIRKDKELRDAFLQKNGNKDIMLWSRYGMNPGKPDTTRSLLSSPNGLHYEKCCIHPFWSVSTEDVICVHILAYVCFMFWCVRSW